MPLRSQTAQSSSHTRARKPQEHVLYDSSSSTEPFRSFSSQVRPRYISVPPFHGPLLAAQIAPAFHPVVCPRQSRLNKTRIPDPRKPSREPRPRNFSSRGCGALASRPATPTPEQTRGCPRGTPTSRGRGSRLESTIRDSCGRLPRARHTLERTWPGVEPKMPPGAG